MTKVQRFLALTSLERVLFVQASILLSLVQVSLVVFGCRRTQAWLHTMTFLPPIVRSDMHGHPLVLTVDRMVNAAAGSGLFTATCLPRALVTCTLLRCNREKATLKLGVRRHSGGIEAHAWVETTRAKSFTGDQGPGYVELEPPLPIS